MTAAAGFASQSTQKLFTRKMRGIQNDKTVSPTRESGFYLFDTGALVVPSAYRDEQNDEYYTVQFPDNCYLWGLKVTAGDFDTHATPTAVIDVQTQDSAGTEVVLINASTIAQAGGSDELDADLGVLDVSNKYLGIKFETAPATANPSTTAATIRFFGVVWIGDTVSIS